MKTVIFAAMKGILLCLYNWLFGSKLYVIADPKDNSITLSRGLFSHMGGMSLDKAKVYVFYVPARGAYGFTLNPSLDKPTQLCDIQYNSKHQCIGFETLCPTVNRIFYDYSLPHDMKCKLSVRARRTADATLWYEIVKPKPKKSC